MHRLDRVERNLAALFLPGCFLVGFFLAMSRPAQAAETALANVSAWLAFPFVGLLLSIALGPVFIRPLWHVHYDKIAALWALIALALLVATQGAPATVAAFVHNMLKDYLPFILMLFALYTSAGGIVIRRLTPATPFGNSILLAIGFAAASLIGTTGASMILIRPLLRANEGRKHRVHIVIFFIFLVSNIGGALSPLGDPPLFFGFLRGIDFSWPLRNLWPETLFVAVMALLVFFCLEMFYQRRERLAPAHGDKAPRAPAGRGGAIEGIVNIALVLVAVAAIVFSAIWHPGVEWRFVGTRIGLQEIARDGLMLLVGLVSLLVTSKDLRLANGFNWGPLEEVAKLFAAIFVCIIPVTAMLAATTHGPLAPLISVLSNADGTPNEKIYFWMTGLLSAFLDNAPTYLVFFGLAGGDPVQLMGPLAKTLAAISLGSVYMGALTYIGNAPNFMVYAMARRARVPMPGFFGYMLWSGGVLVPIFGLVTYLFL